MGLAGRFATSKAPTTAKAPNPTAMIAPSAGSPPDTPTRRSSQKNAQIPAT